MKYAELAKVYEVGPIAVSEDRAQDCSYKVEVLRDVGDTEAYRLFLWSKDRYFVRRRSKNSDVPDNRTQDNPYQVEVRRDAEEAEEYLSFNWNKDNFVKQLKENRDDWEEKLIEAKDNSVLWEEMRGSTVDEVPSQLTETLATVFPALGGKMSNMHYKELVRIVDLEPISTEETNQYYHFRIEIMRDESSEKGYQARVYRRESYSLQPTFAVDGELAYDIADCWLWIEDEQNLLGKIEGDTVEEVIEQAVSARDEFEARLRVDNSHSDGGVGRLRNEHAHRLRLRVTRFTVDTILQDQP
jgi:hypothetical protein